MKSNTLNSSIFRIAAILTAVIIATFGSSAVAQNAYTMRITFDGYNRVGANVLTNFPALVVFTNNVGGSSFSFSSQPFADQQNAYDLRFYDEANNLLDYEIDTYTPGVELWAWVKVLKIKPDGSTFIRAVWGDPDDAEQQPSTANGAVWSENY